MTNTDQMPVPVLAAIRAHVPLNIPMTESAESVSKSALSRLFGLNPDAEPVVLLVYTNAQLTGPRRRLQTWAEFLATVESQEGGRS